MRTWRTMLLIGVLLGVTRHLPAPISEQPTPSPTSNAKIGRFAGTWSGTVPFKDPFVGGGGNQQCDFIVNPEETSMTIRVSKPGGGGHHTATTRITVIGNTASAKGGFLKHMSTTLTLRGDGTTGEVVVHDVIWGTSSGTVKKIQ